MKVLIVTVPMKSKIEAVKYPVDGNKAIEYEKSVYCPVNGILAKTLKEGEELKVIYIMTSGEYSNCEKNKRLFMEELNGINAEIGAIINYDMVEIEFKATKKTYNKLLTDLTENIPENAEIFTDITFGFKSEILSLFCALRFVEEFRDAIVQYIVYGKAEFNREGQIENPLLYDITSLYYLFKLIGTIGATDFENASKMLKDFFTL